MQNGWHSNAQNTQGFTALHLAANGGNFEILDLLLRHKADVGVINKWGDTALGVAIDACELSCAHLLLKAGSRIDGLGESGRTPLQLLCNKHQRSYSEGRTERSLKFLIENGVDVNLGYPRPLEIALEHSSASVVNTLLDAGARVELLSRGCLEELRRPTSKKDPFYFGERTEKLRMIQSCFARS